MNAAPSRLHGRRIGRPLRVRKSRLMEEFLPQLQIGLPEKPPLDPHGLFDVRPTSVWIEIGFGGGEHLAAQAKNNPEIGFIGCEPFVNGVASLLDHLDRDQIRNVRVFPDDARLLLEAVPEASIDRCFVLFADPWPKARHAKRRFIGPDNIESLARALKKGAELRLATDHKQLAEWMRETMGASKEFKSLEDSTTPPADWVQTRYEQKAIKAGRQPAYMSYRRV